MIARIVVLLAGLLAGVSSSQLPEFVQQYQQRLGGAVDELRSFVAEFDADAARHNLSRDEALARYRASGDAFLDTRSGRVVGLIRRYERLSEHREELQQAAPFERLYVFARDYEPEFVQATYRDYEPAVPVTGEGLAHAGAGLIAGLAGARLVVGILRLLRRRARRPA